MHSFQLSEWEREGVGRERMDHQAGSKVSAQSQRWVLKFKNPKIMT